MTLAYGFLLAAENQCCSGITFVGNAELFPLAFLIKWAELCSVVKVVQPFTSSSANLFFRSIASWTARQLLHMSDSLGRQAVVMVMDAA